MSDEERVLSGNSRKRHHFVAGVSAWWQYVFLFFAVILLSTVHVVSYTQMSPVDELVHFDYVVKAPAVVHAGDLIGQEAMHEFACRGMENYKALPCVERGSYDPNDFPFSGENTAAVYTPLYYLMTKIMAVPIQSVLGLQSLLTAARLVSGIWTALGLVAVLGIASKLGANRSVASLLLLGVAATPSVLVPSATVTPDSMSILVGAVVIWSILWWEAKPKSRFWVPPIIAIIAVSIKALNAVALMVIGIYVLLRCWRRWAESRDNRADKSTRTPTFFRSILMLTLTVVSALFGSVGYVYLSTRERDGSQSIAQMYSASQFPLSGFLNHLGAFIDSLYVPGWFLTTGDVGTVLQRLVSFILIAGVVAAALFAVNAGSIIRDLGMAQLISGFIAAPFIVVFTWVLADMYVPIPGRYALTLIPGAAILASLLIDRRRGCFLIGLVSLLGYVGTLYLLAVD